MAGVKYKLAKFIGKNSKYLLKVLPTGGNSFPGLTFIKITGEENIYDLSKEQLEEGAVLITGTNGKTTTTTMIIDLLSKDVDLSSSLGNNTIYAVTTGLLRKKSKLGVFEYGIRDIEHGMPDTIQRLVDPIGVVYTNISREHTQVLGVKNSFDDYVRAKTLLSQGMTNGVIISNCDDPYTQNIAENKKDDVNVIYYGFDIDLDDIFDEVDTLCPVCKSKLQYTQYFMNHRGKYSCECGFKRQEPNVKLSSFTQEENRWIITVEGSLENYILKQEVKINATMNIPILGIHNLYNILTAITTYATFTTNIQDINSKIEDYYNNIDFTILPPGRFELLDVDGKTVGIGQGDNGDALKSNALLMNLHTKGPLEFIYNTPDEYEEEIFEDHLQSIKALKPEHLIMLPGRTSIKKAEEYYNQIKDDYNSDFYPVEFDFEKRITKVIDLIKNSEYEYIFVSGCGEEEVFWNEMKNRLQKNK